MKKLFLDFDCTIADSIKTYCNVYNFSYKGQKGFKEADHNKVNRYGLKDRCHLVEHQETIFSNEEFFKHLEFMTDAKDVIEKLETKYELIICSIGTLDNISHKAKWIKNNFPFIKNVILITGAMGISGLKMDKDVLTGKKSKSYCCNKQ